MFFYQLSIHGTSDIDSSIKFYSKKIYKTKELALSGKADFVRKCSSGEFINLNLDSPYKINIIELELEEI